ncbi:MAG: glycosyltransferase family 39 protein [Gemmataceae bacterium]|nr:glycosyltransferase family 39 protein [Gemmataceae bacterium]
MDAPELEPHARWRWRALALVLILGSAALRLAYLAGDCPLDLAPDEAHYWDWSRHLDWSYYSKGPVVACLIRAGCALAGPFAADLTGTEALAVRLPAVLCGALLLLSVYVLTVQVCRREALACAAVAVGLTLPVIAAGSTLMTIDAPYTCCWGWALVLGHRAVFRGSGWAWPAAGLVVGLGILAKYTMVLWLPSLALFLLTSPDHRRLLLRPGPWVAGGVAAVCCLPILLWNAQHDWVSFRHISGLAGLRERAAGVRWLGPLNFVAVQFLLFLGFWFIVWVRAMVTYRPWAETRPEYRYLWWTSAPMFLVFLLFALKTGGGEPNWPVTAYVSGLVLGVAWLARELRAARGWYRGLTVGGLGVTCALGVLLTLTVHHSAWAWPALTRLAGPPTETQPLPLRRVDPTCRLRGWKTLGAAVDETCDALRRTGVEPVLAASSWSLPGEVAFYCRGHPTVYSFGLPFGDRRSQYDFWRPNPVADPDVFLGRTFVVVSPGPLRLEEMFARVEPSRVVTHTEAGQPVARWHVTVCRGYRGSDALAGGNGSPAY